MATGGDRRRGKVLTMEILLWALQEVGAAGQSPPQNITLFKAEQY